jgi:single-stranded-DNA-specific exonuclease
LNDENWHKGVIGIVASRLIEQYYRPTILLTKAEDQKWVGSGRSVAGYDLYSALEECAPYLVQFGGHKYAAGLTLKDADLEAFREKFEEVVKSTISEDQRTPTLEIAYELGFEYLNPKFIRLLKRFGPFGPGNREPVFITKDVKVRDCRILKEAHVRLVLEHNGVTFEAIGFGLAQKWDEINQLTLNVAYHAGLKTYRGATSLQLRLMDIQSVF